MGKWDKFSNMARESMQRAKIEAQRLGCDHIGTPHVMMGILSSENSASRILSSMGITYDLFSNEYSKVYVPSSDSVADIKLSYTSTTKRVLEYAISEARKNSHKSVCNTHLLLGLIKETKGLASQILLNMKVDLDDLREYVLESDPDFSVDRLFDGSGVDTAGPDLTGTPVIESSNTATKSATPALDSFGRDMTQLAREKKLDPLVGRSQQVDRVFRILMRRTKNNPVLIGEPGVGKTAIVEGIAQRIAQGNAPVEMLDNKVIALDLALLVAGTKYRGQFEERMKAIVKEAKDAGNVFLFIDELHTLIGTGSAEGSQDAANILKPSLARGGLQCIGATTMDEYRKYIEKDAALERRFQPVHVDEPTEEEAISILKGLKPRYERHHRVEIQDEAVEEAVRLSNRYVTDRFLPDKAIDLIDEAGSEVRMATSRRSPVLESMEKTYSRLVSDKEAAVGMTKFEVAGEIRDMSKDLGEVISAVKESTSPDVSSIYGVVTPDTIREMVYSMTKIPVKHLNDDEAELLADMGETLRESVVGQDEAIGLISSAVKRSRAGLGDPNRPVASMMFLGPTGVGKTLLAKALAKLLFGTEDSLIRVDMSEYMEKHTVSRLVGAPPGYVGHEDGGQLTERVRRRPYCIVLFDEIEKAHPDVFNILLQVMEEGNLTDGHGRKVNFRNTIVIMSSNVGAESMKDNRSMGFGGGSSNDFSKVRSQIRSQLEREFRPEFLNRLDETVIFGPLSDDSMRDIVRIETKKVVDRLFDKGISMYVDESAETYLAKKGYDPEYGARPVRRLIQREIENPVSEKVVSGDIKTGDDITVLYDGDRIDVVVRR